MSKGEIGGVASVVCPPLCEVVNGVGGGCAVPSFCSRLLKSGSWVFRSFFLSFVQREGNGTPLQYSCLENPMDGRAWNAAVLGVAEGQT